MATRPGHDPAAADATWQEFVARVGCGLTLPFADHWQLYEELFRDRPAEDGPPLAWQPGEEELDRSQLGLLMADLGFASFDDLADWSRGDRAGFWREVVRRLGIVFARSPDAILVGGNGETPHRWLPGAELNIVSSCFQVEPARVAVVSAREDGAGLEHTSYGELERLVDRVASGLAARGLGEGAAVALYLPMTVECVAAYLGVVKGGGAVVSIADSFAPEEVAKRLAAGGAAAVVTVDRFRRGGRWVDLYDRVQRAGAPPAVVIPAEADAPPRLRPGDLLWSDFLGPDAPVAAAVGDPSRVTNVLFSSGTTGTPKAIPWSHLTPLKCAMDGRYHLDIGPRDVVAWPTSIGWMMGPWLVYAALVNGATIALWEGTPTGPGFVRFVEEAGVTVLGVVPSLVRAWRDDPATAELEWSTVRVFGSTGEPSNPQDYLWLMSRTRYRAPVVEYCGGTEIGGGYITGTVVQPSSPATFTTPALGLDLVLLDEAGEEVGEGGAGEVFLVPPSIGLSERLLNADHDEVYHRDCPPGPAGETLRRHGDRLERLARGFYRARGRADDAMNLGGIKVDPLEVERVVGLHPGVAGAAAVAVPPEGGGADRLVLFVVLRRPLGEGDLRSELQRLIGEHLNPLFRVHDLVEVDQLPRTASNKLLRRELRARYR